MTESRYEKYIARQANPPADLTPYLVDGMIPFRWLDDSMVGLVEEAKALVEFSWITKDIAMGHSTGRGPHKHNFDELFIFVGTNPEDSNYLGAEVEFWLGEGKETDTLTFNTSSLVYVPAELMHMPIFFRNVKRPLLRITLGVNNFQKGKTRTDRFPPREL
jgi:hypothetical protein